MIEGMGPSVDDQATHVNGNSTTTASDAGLLRSKQVNGSHAPLPEVGDLDSKSYASEDALVKDIIESMRTSGGCIIRRLLSRETVAEIEKDVRPYLSAAEAWNGDFWPPETRKVMGLMGKSEKFALNVVGNPIWQRIGEHFLTSVLNDYWVGSEKLESVSKPQLNNTVVFSVGPGAKAQVLHRDDIIHHTYPAAAVTTHTLGRDNGIGFFVAGKKSTRQNGATRFVPGSHLWHYATPPPAPEVESESCVYAELEPGDAFMLFSGCYHAASANQTTDQERLLFSTFTTRGYLRQEENQYLANDVDSIKRLPIWLQRFAGYSLSRPFMGWVDMDDPMRVINPDAESLGDLF
jgi:ectoine hydroxylase-related dioxygenase (phytanoyl-CoA dioxygenase family)